jgi:hypothetical protein
MATATLRCRCCCTRAWMDGVQLVRVSVSEGGRQRQQT